MVEATLNQGHRAPKKAPSLSNGNVPGYDAGRSIFHKRRFRKRGGTSSRLAAEMPLMIASDIYSQSVEPLLRTRKGF